MEEKNKERGNTVKRRSFLYYMGGISLAAAFAKNPFKFFGGKATERAVNMSSMKVKPNPDAVKRNSEMVK